MPGKLDSFKALSAQDKRHAVVNWLLDHAMIIIILLLAVYVQIQRPQFFGGQRHHRTFPSGNAHRTGQTHQEIFAVHGLHPFFSPGKPAAFMDGRNPPLLRF